MIKSIIKRFLKGFIAGGIASVVLALQAGITISSLTDVKTLLTALGVAFVTGGLLAIEKGLNWTPEQLY